MLKIKNIKIILIWIVLVQLLSTSALMYLGHYQHVTVLSMMIEEEHRRADNITKILFEEVTKEYTRYGQELLSDPALLEAFAEGDRKRLLALSNPTFKRLKKHNPYLTLMHFHTPQTHSFLRLHRPEKYGDDLSALRSIIVDTNRFKRIHTGIEIGKYGIYYRLAFPVFRENRHIGAFELGIDIKYLVSKLAEQNTVIPQLLITKAAAAPAYQHDTTVDTYLKPFDEQYVFIHYAAGKGAEYDALSMMDRRLLNDSAYITAQDDKSYLVFRGKAVKDYAQREIGYFAYAQNIDYYMDAIAFIRWLSILTTILLLVLTIGLIYWVIRKYTATLFKKQSELAALSSKLANVLDGANLGYWDWNVQTDEYQVNERCLELVGLDRSDIKNHVSDWRERIHPDDKERIIPQIKEAVKNDANYRVEFRMRHQDGHYVWIESSGAVVEHDENGEPLRLSGTRQDISIRKNLELENEQNRQYLDVLFAYNPNIIVVTDGTKMVDANQKFFEFFDAFENIEAFLASYDCVCDFFELLDDKEYLHPSRGSWVLQSIGHKSKKVLMRKDEKAYYFSVHSEQVSIGHDIYYLSTLTDITHEHMLQEELERIAIIDPLTQLYNRRHFNLLFEREIKRARRDQKPFTLMMIDIDNFKKYNDNYGHDAGDKALQQVAASMLACLKRPSDYLFRLGGEEFGIIFSGVTPAGSVAYADQIRQSIEELAIEHRYNPPLSIHTISVGVCCTDFGIQEHDQSTIYRMADEALYRAKEQGRNRVVSSECKG